MEPDHIGEVKCQVDAPGLPVDSYWRPTSVVGEEQIPKMSIAMDHNLCIDPRLCRPESEHQRGVKCSQRPCDCTRPDTRWPRIGIPL